MAIKIDNGLHKRKVKVFLVFLTCSFLAWLISRLSETYTQNSSFDLVYTNTPDSLKLIEASKDHVDIVLRARGFQFLRFNFAPKKINIDLSTVNYGHSRFFIPELVYRKQIEQQLYGSMTLLEIDNDTLFFDFFTIATREVPVQPAVEINLGQNFLLDGGLTVNPPTIVIKGPSEEIDTVDHLTTQNTELDNVTKDFSKLIPLHKPEGLANTTFSDRSVTVSGKVFRFSEKIIKVPVEVENRPAGTEVKTFPNAISILCKGRIENLKNLGASDFRIIADFSTAKENSPYLEVKLSKIPKRIHSTQLMENQVEYIIKRK